MDPQGRIAELETELQAKDARIQEIELLAAKQAEQIVALLKQVEVLTEKLGRNSKNSNLPPSSDPPGAGSRGKGKDNAKGKGRSRGGQIGHKGHRRELAPQDQVDEFVDLFPPECENCWRLLPEVPDPEHQRYQHIEIPPIKPHITEVRQHSVVCPDCGYKTCAPHDTSKIPPSPFGARLMAVIALLTGVYHVSRRKTVTLLFDLLGIRISLGALSTVEGRVSEAIEPAVEEAWQKVGEAEVKHTDGTGWKQAGAARSLWTIATVMATVFKIVIDGTRATLQPLYGTLAGILVSDRATALLFWAMNRRQICWAHLLRKFVWFSEKAGPASPIGLRLLDYTGLMFDYWHRYKDGTISRAQLRAWMVPVQAQMEALLQRAASSGIDGLSGACADILKHKDALWTFLEHEGVEPTNNHAECELRGFVLWRRRSFGTQSDRGNLFAERIMTVAHTARKQHRNVLEFLIACCRARADGAAKPSLFDSSIAPTT